MQTIQRSPVYQFALQSGIYTLILPEASALRPVLTELLGLTPLVYALQAVQNHLLTTKRTSALLIAPRRRDTTLTIKTGVRVYLPFQRLYLRYRPDM